MIRIVIDISGGGDPQAIKEAVAMRLEGLGRVRIVSVKADDSDQMEIANKK